MGFSPEEYGLDEGATAGIGKDEQTEEIASSDNPDERAFSPKDEEGKSKEQE
jgi:hypothetical protein